MPDDQKEDPVVRFRRIINFGKDKPVLSRLPPAKINPQQINNSGGDTRRVEAQRSSGFRAFFRGLRIAPAFWTISSIISLVVNVILIASLISMWRNLTSIQSAAGDVGVGLLGGLYTNFEKMDRAHIRTIIPINSAIPVKFDLQINQPTEVVLNQDVNITGALVTLQTGGLEIVRAPTNIVLPAGTRLPINLNLTVPVDQMVPVQMNVPVDIALNQTDLHEPFVGLQEVVKPFYCVVEPNAIGVNQQLICK